MQEKKKANGWTTLWPWVILVFAGLIVAWVALISVASENAPEKMEARFLLQIFTTNEPKVGS